MLELVLRTVQIQEENRMAENLVGGQMTEM